MSYFRVSWLKRFQSSIDITFSSDVDLTTTARGTGGFSGADLANLINQAAIRGSALGRDAVTTDDIDFAKDKIVMGNE